MSDIFSEGLLDSLKAKELGKEDHDKYIDFLNGIYKKHLPEWKKIINDSFRGKFLGLKCDVKSSPKFKIHKGKRANTDLAFITTSMVANNDAENTRLTYEITYCDSKLSSYNKKNNIPYIHIYFENNLTGYRVYIGVILSNIKKDVLSDTKNESSIFECVEFL